MLEQTEQKKSLKLKSMFRQQLDEQSNNSSTLHKKAAVAHLQISPPILQHSTSIYSLVSPTRTAFTNIYTPSDGSKKEIPFELYQPLSPPPPIPQHKSPWASNQGPNSLSPAPPPQQQRRANPIRREFERPMHPLEFVPDVVPVNNNKERNPNKARYADARRTVATDPRGEQQADEDYVKAATSNKNRRHSCSSTVIYKQQDQIRIPIKEAQQPQQPQQQQQKSELARVKSFRSKLKERRRSSKVASSYSTSSSVAATTVAAIDHQPCMVMEVSKSTPLRGGVGKVKTYNVPKRLNTIQDVEKQRKMQELEDLISGRRGSTLKLTLTPKGLS